MNNSVIAAQPQRTTQRHSRLRWIAGVAGGIAVLAAAWFGFMLYRMSYVPSNLDLATTRLSNAGAFRVGYTPRRGPIAINQLHSWTIHVATPDGRPVTGATITVDGDMPQHGHGLPTRPLVTKSLGNGDYLVEGMKFHMGGWWVVDFTIDAGGQHDTVRFNLILK